VGWPTRDSKLWIELSEKQKKTELRLGVDDQPLLGASREGGRAIFFTPVAENRHHFTMVGDPRSQRVTFHETIQYVDLVGDVRIHWSENAKPALVLSGPHLQRRLGDERFHAALRARILGACRFMRRPRDFRAEGIVAVFPTPTASDLRPVTGTRYELQLAAFGPEPVEALWRRRPGALFLPIGVNLKPVGIATLLEDQRAVLVRWRDIFPVVGDLMRALSEPRSPPSRSLVVEHAE
jgi:hypothetical protein